MGATATGGVLLVAVVLGGTLATGLEEGGGGVADGARCVAAGDGEDGPVARGERSHATTAIKNTSRTAPMMAIVLDVNAGSDGAGGTWGPDGADGTGRSDGFSGMTSVMSGTSFGSPDCGGATGRSTGLPRAAQNSSRFLRLVATNG